MHGQRRPPDARQRRQLQSARQVCAPASRVLRGIHGRRLRPDEDRYRGVAARVDARFLAARAGASPAGHRLLATGVRGKHEGIFAVEF